MCGLGKIGGSGVLGATLKIFNAGTTAVLCFVIAAVVGTVGAVVGAVDAGVVVVVEVRVVLLSVDVLLLLPVLFGVVGRAELEEEDEELGVVGLALEELVGRAPSDDVVDLGVVGFC